VTAPVIESAPRACRFCHRPIATSDQWCIRRIAPLRCEPAQLPHCGARWPNRGPAGDWWTCTLDRGHEGDHEAGVPADGRPFYSSVPQDDDEITWDES
jgi:hypothetical protein